VSLRQKLLLMFSLTVAIAVATVGWTVSLRVRSVFERQDQEQTALFVSQFRREFDLRANAVAETLDRVASSEHMTRIAQELALTGDSSPYLRDAAFLARENHLDYLELVGADRGIVSSAQWPARFGYPEPEAADASRAPFLKQEALPDGTTELGLFAVRAVGNGQAVVLVGGRKLDESFLAELPVPTGTSLYLYRVDPAVTPDAAGSAPPAFDPQRLMGLNGASGQAVSAAKYQPLLDSAVRTGQQTSGLVYLSPRREDSVNATAIPLKARTGQVLAVLLTANSRRGMVEVQQHIRSIALGVAAGGILFAIAASLWIAARVSGPIERLARAAEQVAQGDWETHVEVRSKDEVGVLGASFNHMTRQLAEQREKLVQTERVAAWRELARRLAHELKNPLFPLQLTVENLVRAKDGSASLAPGEFDEIFRESTRTLGMEIANLKAIIGRFSDFSRMPRPQLEAMDAREAVRRVYALYGAPQSNKIAATAGEGTSRPGIRFELDLAPDPLPISADPELLHRALSNLVLNAMDAMQEGGTLTLSAMRREDKVRICIADTGSSMTPEERERIFTPYYTTKEYGTGLGLAIVQSVVADHHGTIAVEDTPGGGATFAIDLPAADGSEAQA
jgi:signal transduction histidine kinase